MYPTPKKMAEAADAMEGAVLLWISRERRRDPKLRVTAEYCRMTAWMYAAFALGAAADDALEYVAQWQASVRHSLARAELLANEEATQ